MACTCSLKDNSKRIYTKLYKAGVKAKKPLPLLSKSDRIKNENKAIKTKQKQTNKQN